MASLIQLPCLCATIRRASRTLTSLYDEALQAHGMTATQFTVLQALKLAGPVTQGQLGEILALDSTTLTRSLRSLIQSRWINRSRGQDRREWRLALSKYGLSAYNSAAADWLMAQERVRRTLGHAGWTKAFKFADQVTTAVKRTGAKQ